jgi:hypothetical protein
VHSARRRAADDKRTAEVQGQTKPFFTPSAEPIPPEYYHNVAGRDGIFIIAMKSEAFTKGAQAMKDELETLLNTMAPPSNLSLLPDLDPPSYLPMREPLPPRVPDLNPDERDLMRYPSPLHYAVDTQWSTDELAAHDAEKAIDEANWLAQLDAELAAGIVPVDDGPDISFDRPAPIHNPETCRDPACDCYPF